MSWLLSFPCFVRFSRSGPFSSEHEGRRLPGGGVGRAGRAVVALVGGGVADEGRGIRHGRPRRPCNAARRAQMGRHRRCKRKNAFAFLFFMSSCACMTSSRSHSRLMLQANQLLPLFQNVVRFDFSKFIYFIMYLNICYI